MSTITTSSHTSPDIQKGFTHRDLALHLNEIRVFRIDEVCEDATISLTLSHGRLSELSYTCVSYAWGEELPVQEVHVRQSDQGPYKSFPVRDNLFRFLQRAREIKIGDLLWVDALCISQNNVMERNHQVGKMSAIFQRAQRVLIWPGSIDTPRWGSLRLYINGLLQMLDEPSIFDAEDWSAWPLRAEKTVQLQTERGFAEENLGRPRLPGMARRSKVGYQKRERNRKVLRSDKISKALERPLTTMTEMTHKCVDDEDKVVQPELSWGQVLMQSVSHSPYWQRQWIIQEIFLAKDPQLLVGSELVPFWDLPRLYNDVFEQRKRKSHPRTSYERRSDLESGGFLSRPHVQFPPSEEDYIAGYLRKTMIDPIASQLELFCQKGQYGRTSVGLGRCMELSQRALCSDRRDRIYSMTGMCAALAGLPVDYRTDEAGLLLNICCHIKAPTLWELISLISNLGIAIDADTCILCSQHRVWYLGKSSAEQGTYSRPSDGVDTMLTHDKSSMTGARRPRKRGPGSLAPELNEEMVHDRCLLLAKRDYDVKQLPDCDRCLLLIRTARTHYIDWRNSHRIGAYIIDLVANCGPELSADGPQTHLPHLFTWPGIAGPGQR